MLAVTLRRSCIGLLVGWLSAVPGHAAPQAFRVTHARLEDGLQSNGDTRRVFIRAIADEQARGAGTLAAALLSNTASVTVSDGRRVIATVPLVGCHNGTAGIWCDGGQVRAVISRIENSSRYHVRLAIRQPGSTATETVPLNRPVTVTLRIVGGTDYVDVISDCRLGGPYRLGCRDRNRPNIVFIVTDDQRWDTLQHMPRTLDRIAAHGVTFANAFVPTPLCGPSRASMLTGRLARHHGVLTNAGQSGGATALIGADTSTIATWLHDAGYRTGMYGKYMVGYSAQCPPYRASCYRPPGWDEWHVFWTQHYYGYMLDENGVDSSYGFTEADYSTDVITARSVEFIRSAHGQPFFLHVGYHAPHAELSGYAVAAMRHKYRFIGLPPLIPRPLPPWRPPSWDEPDVSDKPPWFANLRRAADTLTGTITWGVFAEDVRLLQLEAALAVDEGVESIVRALEATGQADNTIIVFTSDNGHFWGEHRFFAGKDYPYDESIRIPLVIRYPRVIASARSEPALVLSVDIPPTLARLAGVQPSLAVDGKDLGPLLRQETSSVRDAVPLEWWNLVGAPGLTSYTGVRTADWKYVTYPEAAEAELYDLVADPYELDNRAHDADYQDEVATLQARLDALLAAD